MTELVFWLAVVFLVYTYFGYPLAIWILAHQYRDSTPEISDEFDWPPVTVVIAVHNEAPRIEKKVANLRGLDYPQDRLIILFVSDGSGDSTNDVLAQVSNIDWYAYSPRRGKPYALNRGIERAVTPIVVFADVRQEIEVTALKHLVCHLSQPGIGAVSGELVHRDPVNHTAASIGLYWRYEKWIRKSEGRFGSVVGATGAFYAIRREDYVPLAEDALLDDFEIPMQIVRRGRRNVLNSRAIFYDDLQSDTKGERKRKIRTLTGNYQAFARNYWLFSPSQNPVFVQFLSHKVFRLLVPYALIAGFMASAYIGTPFYTLVAVLQGLFYAIAVAGASIPTLRRNRLIGFAAVFLEMNLSAVIAMMKYAFSRVDARWEKT